MVTDFQERLRRIREQKDRESREQRALESAAELERFNQMEARFQRRERVDEVITAFGDKFMAEVAGFSRSKSFFEGKYQIEVHHDDVVIEETGDLKKKFSRVTFLLDTTTEPIKVSCKKTIRNRDLESTGTAVPPAADGEALEQFEKWVEEQFVEFASAFFSPSSPAAR